MTFRDLANLIARMTHQQQVQQMRFIEDLDGPNQRIVPVAIAEAIQDVFDGISVGNELVVFEGGFFLCPARQ